MAIFLLVFALLSPGIPHESQLRDTVAAYWKLMANGEKAAAMKFVLPSSQNDFVNRPEPKIRTWSLLSVEPTNNNEAVVTIKMEALFKEAVVNGFQTVEKRETWVRDKNRWKLKFTKPSVEAVGKILSGTNDQPLPKVLRITPTILKIQFFSKPQTGRLLIQNGMSSPAEFVSVKFDETRFDVAERPSQIEAGKTGRLILHYKGDENDKNLKSQMTVVLKQDGEEKVYQIPVIYNYFSDGARALFGLTEEQARLVKRGDKLRPVIKQPGGDAQPAPLPPTPPAGQK